MSITTQLYIGSVGWNNKYTHVVNFASPSERSGYFTSNFTLQGTVQRLLDRESGVVELDMTYTTLIREKHNYLWVREIHTDYVYEWFAFITGVTRNSKDTAIVNYEVDYWQTYHFDKDGNNVVFDIKDAFIQREHQDRWVKDGIGLKPIYSRTIEGLEVGDMIKVNQKVLRNYLIDKSTGKKTNLYIEPYLAVVNANINPYNDYRLRFSRVNEYGVSELTYALYFSIKEYVDGDSEYYVYVDPTKASNTFIKTRGQYGDTVRMYRYNSNIDDYTQFKTGEVLGNRLGQWYQWNSNNNKDELKGEFIGATDERLLMVKKLPYLPFKTYVTVGDDDITLEFDYPAYEGEDKVILANEVDGVKEYVLTVNTSRPQDITLHEFEPIRIPQFTQNTQASPTLEPKLYTQEFNVYKVNTFKTEPLNILIENIGDQQSKITYRNSLDMFAQNDVTIKDYNNNDENYRIRFDTNNELILMTDAYKNYIRTNRQQIATTETMGGINAGIGLASTIIGGVALAGFGGPIGVGMGLGLLAGGVAQTLNASGTIAQSMAKKEDYKQKVDQVKANVNSINLDIGDSGDAFRLTEYRVRDEYLQRAWQLFMKQGYLTNEYRKPNLNTRYYYNYIKCGYVELNPQAIGEDAVRKIIEGIYLNGTTIWHYRNPSTFKVLDYSKENVEMSLLS